MTATTAPRYVAYYRVSTMQQGRSGLGLEAQQAAVEQYVAQHGGTLIAPPYQEVESGKRADRPQLALALERCRLTNATLVVAKLDRLTRDVSFLCKLRDSNVDFVAVDNPNANRLTVTILVAVAEEERNLISARTKAALQAAKARGVKLGCPLGAKAFGDRTRQGAADAVKAKADSFARSLASTVLPLRDQGLSLRAIAGRLNADCILTAKGKAWQAATVKNLLARLDSMAS